MDDISFIIKKIESGNLDTEYVNKLLSDFSIDQSAINEVNSRMAFLLYLSSLLCPRTGF